VRHEVPDQTPQRRLAAILAADVAGYSRMMGANEVGTFDRGRKARWGRIAVPARLWKTSC
jgi:adenylate cyclase